MDLYIKLIIYLRNHDRGLLLSLLAVVCLIYLPFLSNPFVFDDLNFFSANIARIYSESGFHFDLRWLSYASLGRTWKIFYDLPPAYRIGNLLLHTTNSVLLFFLLRQLILLGPQKIRGYSLWGAWLGALFFAINPVAVYAVGYMIQRSILLATLFTLAMQLAYLRGLIGQGKSRQTLWLLLSVLFYFLAVFSKEHSLMAPAIVIATTGLLRPQIRANRQLLWLTWIGYLIIGIFVVLCAKGVFGVAYEIGASSLFEQQHIAGSSTTLHLLSIFTQTGLYFKYLFLWWLPNPAWMSVDMRETFSSTLGSWQNWIKVTVFIVYALIGWKLLLRRGRLGLLGLGMLYPWLFFLVDLSTIRVQEPFVLYRSYLWMPGMMLFFPLVLSALPSLKKTTTALITITLLLVLVPLSWNRLWVFADSYRLWNDAALLLESERTPGAARIYYNRGNAELGIGHWEKAIADFERVKTINPEIQQVYANIGRAEFNLGKYTSAIASFDQAVALNPDYAEAYFGKSMALKRLQMNDESLKYMIKSCALGNNTACIIVTFQGYSK